MPYRSGNHVNPIEKGSVAQEEQLQESIHLSVTSLISHFHSLNSLKWLENTCLGDWINHLLIKLLQKPGGEENYIFD